MIRVLVAAARPTVRAGLAAVVRAGNELEVVGEAAGGSDLLALAATQSPDVVLAELETEGEALGVALGSLIAESPAMGVVVLCDGGDAWVTRALRQGVRGILSRDADSREITAAIAATAYGLLVLPLAAGRALLPAETAATPSAHPDQPIEPLTARELEVLRLLGAGLGNKTIALRLRISEHTVKFHVGAVMAKLGASSRTEAVAIAARRGLIML